MMIMITTSLPHHSLSILCLSVIILVGAYLWKNISQRKTGVRWIALFTKYNEMVYMMREYANFYL